MRNRFHDKGHWLALFDRASNAPRELLPRGELMRRRRKVTADPQVAHRIDWHAYHSSIQEQDFVPSQDNSLIKIEPNHLSSLSRGRIVNRFGSSGMSKTRSPRRGETSGCRSAMGSPRSAPCRIDTAMPGRKPQVPGLSKFPREGASGFRC